MAIPSNIRITVSGSRLDPQRTRQIASLVEGYLFINSIDDVSVSVVELQDEPNPLFTVAEAKGAAALTIKVDSGDVRTAISDMDRLAGAARNAHKAIERLNALTAGRSK